ncbi:hypothetical protein BOX15_Mlig016774g1 [Macrostomum lignano]|uniref:Sec23/Sec24 trunk domain-containing protein n=2 Tax=Macrostomum lignano TaxID=282301 RepID=A0A267DYM9_9PLAT|nr:hypothetical protein BOX15_Mlig016774g1 [Macrostomum lignano]
MQPKQPTKPNGSLQLSSAQAQPARSFMPIETMPKIQPSQTSANPTRPIFASTPPLQLPHGSLLHPTPVRSMLSNQPNQMNLHGLNSSSAQAGMAAPPLPLQSHLPKSSMPCPSTSSSVSAPHPSQLRQPPQVSSFEVPSTQTAAANLTSQVHQMRIGSSATPDHRYVGPQSSMMPSSSAAPGYQPIGPLPPPMMPSSSTAPDYQPVGCPPPPMMPSSSAAPGYQPVGCPPPPMMPSSSTAPSHQPVRPLPPSMMPSSSAAPGYQPVGCPPPPMMPSSSTAPSHQPVRPLPPSMMPSSSTAPGHQPVGPPPPGHQPVGPPPPGHQPVGPPQPGHQPVGPPPPPMMPSSSTAPGHRPIGPPEPPMHPISAAAPSPPSFVPAPPAPMPFVAPTPPLPVGPMPRQMTSPPTLQQPQWSTASAQHRENSVNLLRDRQLLRTHGSEPIETVAPPPLGHSFPAEANCNPDVMSCTMNAVPATAELLRRSRLPLGLAMHPFKDLRSLAVIQANVIVRCRDCRAYINPFVRFSSQQRWRCSLCFLDNDLPEEFLYDPMSQTYGDPSRRPEIRNGTVEFIATQEYSVRPPPPATYILALDVSQVLSSDPAVAKSATAYLTAVSQTLLRCLDRLPGDTRTQLAVITFNGVLHLYKLDGPRPSLLAMPDLDGDSDLPMPEGLLVPVAECRDAIVELLESLPELEFPAVPGCCLGSALAIAHRLAQSSGGRLLLFLASRPSVGPGALSGPAGSDSDDLAGQPATDYYKRLALDCCSAQLSVDLFCVGPGHTDLASVMPIAVYSSGRVHRYPRLPDDADRLAADLGRHLTRKLGLEAVLRVRCSNGYSVAAFYGSCFVRATDLAALPCASPDAGFAIQLAVGDGAGTAGASEPVVFQAALLYTGRKGERRIECTRWDCRLLPGLRMCSPGPTSGRLSAFWRKSAPSAS